MKEEVYKAIKLKFEQEKLEIEEEIGKLQIKKVEIINQKIKEENKLKASSEILKEKKVVPAGALVHKFNHVFINQCKKEIALIDNYIGEQNKELEKVKEQEKYVDKVFSQKLKEKESKARKKEEEMLFEYKKWLDFS